ncbi:Small subunit (SSU) processome component [Rhodotorula kratochvilovae]
MGKKSKPVSAPRTTAINPAAVATTLTAFSPSAGGAPSYYAHLHAAPDAHTLRVYDLDGKCVSRWASNANSADGSDDADETRVKSLAWCWVPPAVQDTHADAQGAEGKRGKKRRKSDGGAAADSPAKPSPAALKPQLTLALGLENGTVLLWHPLGTASRTLAHPSSASPVTALALPVSSSAESDGHLWSAHQDGSVRVWDTASGALVGKVSGLVEEPRWDDLLVRYEAAGADGGKRTVHVVLSHLSLHVYAVQLGAPSKKEGKVRDLKATELGRCTGHVEPCSLRWTGASSSATTPANDDVPADKLTFLSYSPTDRFVQIWQIATTAPSPSTHIGLLLARLGTDSGVSSASVSPLSASLAPQTLAAVDSDTGNVTLSALPLSFAPSASPSKKTKKNGLGVVALEALCEISAPAQGGRSEAGVAAVAFREGDEANAILCRGGVKPVFEVAAFKEEGAWVKKLELARNASGLLVGNGTAESAGAPKPTRYTEHASSTAAASAAPDAAAASDDDEVVNAGELDVDMAEPTLADRLKALNVSQKKERRKAARTARLDDDVEVASESSGSEDLDGSDDEELGSDDDDAAGPAVPATTLTTTLVQALHSQDGPLLESCLAHSNPNLVRSTVKRLPSGGLVLSLLEAIVDRLGKQKKGREGLASPKRARALVAWLRETLIIHVGFLVTVPSLVTRLAALHASLSQRLALQAPLLALQGRMELVMSQIDLRQDRARAQTARSGKKAVTAAPKGRRYVEGESTDDEDDAQVEGDDDLSEGDIEDVVLGAGGDRESDDEDDDESGDDDGFGDLEDDDVDSDLDDEEGSAGSKVPRHKRNGVASLLDLEAEDDEDFDEDDESLADGDEDLSDDPEAGEDEEFER